MQLSSLLGHTQELLSLIRKSDKPADSLIDSFFRHRKYLGSHDRKFIAETTYGTLRHLRKCEALLRASLAPDSNGFSESDYFLLLSVAYLRRVAKTPAPEHAVLESLARSAATKNDLIPVLERLEHVQPVVAADPMERLAQEQSFPDWMTIRFLEEFGPQEAEQLCTSLNEPAPLNLRVNTLKGSVEQCMERLREEGVETTRTARSSVGLLVPRRLNIFQLRAFQEGLFEVQDEGSQVLGTLVDPKPTWKVLDACAGAGGKSLHMAAIMKNRGEIIASDINAFRLKELKKRARRAGAFNIRTYSTDTLEQEKKFKNYFDVVFLDAPCSGLGTLRRNPGLKWMVSEEDVAELSAKQGSILDSNAPLVNENGTMYYATCSLLRQENENVIETFLERHPGFEPVDLRAAAGNAGMGDAVSKHYVSLFPHRHGTDGFFCGAVRRTGPGS